MLRYPFVVPHQSVYTLLGVDPEASSDEVRDAKLETCTRLDAELKAINKRLSGIYDKVPGLRQAEKSVSNLMARSSKEGSDCAAGIEALKKTQQEHSLLFRQARAVDPHFADLKHQAGELERQIREMNSLNLDNPRVRDEYDEKHPPFAILKLENCRRDEFRLNNVAVKIVRRELSKYLQTQNEVVYHPSDLSRQDFTGDFSYCPILDD
jgi:hypothetical protein